MQIFRHLTLCGLVFLSFAGRTVSGQSRSDAILVADTLRSIVVFAKFGDDVTAGDPGVSYRGWQHDRTTPPDYANYLLATNPHPPYPDSSLTEYFHLQSLGRYILYGTVHPEVYVSELPEASYHRPEGGYGHLTAEILDHLHDNGYDFRDYDHNNDGLLDYLFVILRRDSVRDAKRITFTGISCLDARCGGGIVGGRPESTPAYDGVTIDWTSSGSILFSRTPGNILPYWYMLRLLAHELGHDIWAPFFTHIPANRRNDVPAKSNRNPSQSCIGYTLMAGSGGAPDCRGDETISAFERDLLGWIECAVPNLTVGSDYVLGDLVSTSDCLRIPTSQPESYLYLTNRQRVSPFDQLRRGGRDEQYDAGLLRTTGLLAMRSEKLSVDILPADNSLDLSIHDRDYQGDLYGKFLSQQITPFTRPNINGFNQYRVHSNIDWFAVDNIRPLTRDETRMTFSFIPDFRTNPSIRSDSWIGPLPDSVTTSGTLLITGQSTLTITGASLRHEGDVIVERGGTLVIGDDANFEVAHCGKLIIKPTGSLLSKGSITFSGDLLASSDARVEIDRLVYQNCSR